MDAVNTPNDSSRVLPDPALIVDSAPRPQPSAERTRLSAGPSHAPHHATRRPHLPSSLHDIERAGPGDRWLGGVASGIAERIGLDVSLVRIAFVALAFASGVGIGIYGLAWLMLPEAPAAVGNRSKRNVLSTAGDPLSAVAFGAVILGFMLLIQQLGLPFPVWLMWPILVLSVGASMISAEGRRSIEHALTRSGSWSWRGQAKRLAIGGLFVFGGLAGVVSKASRLNALTGLFLAVFALVGGLGLILLPWSRSVLRALSEERRARVRSEEKADIAAHLHDSVLQTLAIIQRKAEDPRQVQALARRQERELRAWLFSEADQSASRPLSISELMDVIVEEVEDSYGINVDVVRVGDGPLADESRVLLAAIREVLVNAGKHSGATKVDVYLEVDERELVAFVRDRGKGFDLREVESDRRGLSESIQGRVQRAGGRVLISSAPGEGTEVQLTIARPHHLAPSGDAPTPDSLVPPDETRRSEKKRQRKV